MRTRSQGLPRNEHSGLDSAELSIATLRTQEAGQEAQLSLLRSKEFSNPYFWAAFTLTGQWN